MPSVKTAAVLAYVQVDNLLNVQYTRYLDYLASSGITFKGGGHDPVRSLSGTR